MFLKCFIVSVAISIVSCRNLVREKRQGIPLDGGNFFSNLFTGGLASFGKSLNLGANNVGVSDGFDVFGIGAKEQTGAAWGKNGFDAGKSTSVSTGKLIPGIDNVFTKSDGPSVDWEKGTACNDKGSVDVLGIKLENKDCFNWGDILKAFQR